MSTPDSEKDDGMLGFAVIGRALDYVESLDDDSPLLQAAWKLSDQVAAAVRRADAEGGSYDEARRLLEELRAHVGPK